MTDFTLQATRRDDKGKGASRRLRRLADQVPGIVYGGKKDPAPITLTQKDIAHIIDLQIDGKGEDVILKAVQRHPARPIILHVDFLRVDKSQKLTVRVPLHFLNEESCKGVKLQGGKVTHNMVDLEIQCLPADLPEYIEVDLANLELDDILHISDIPLPEGVESIALAHGEDHDLPVVAIHKPKAVVIEEEETREEPSAEEKSRGESEGEED